MLVLHALAVDDLLFKDYNRLLTSSAAWELLQGTDKLLIFQTDTVRQ